MEKSNLNLFQSLGFILLWFYCELSSSKNANQADLKAECQRDLAKCKNMFVCFSFFFFLVKVLLCCLLPNHGLEAFPWMKHTNTGPQNEAMFLFQDKQEASGEDLRLLSPPLHQVLSSQNEASERSLLLSPLLGHSCPSLLGGTFFHFS